MCKVHESDEKKNIPNDETKGHLMQLLELHLFENKHLELAQDFHHQPRERELKPEITLLMKFDQLT